MKSYSFLNKWIKKQRKNNVITLVKKNFESIEDWDFNGSEIFHNTRSFFKINAFQFEQKTLKKKWYQPLIIQKEVGILGIIKKVINNKDHYLLQAKTEPGNKNGIQLSPTVQATKSNYLRKHKGKKTNYINYFLNKNFNQNFISKKRLSEQGSRYLEKSNFNILTETKKLKLKKNYIWVNKDDLKKLINKKNLINMDTLSVFSSCIKKLTQEKSEEDFIKFKKLVNKFKKRNYIKKKKISFYKLKNWKIKKDKIFDKNKNFFFIKFFKVYASSREIKSWSQPLLSDFSKNLNIFLIKKFGNNNYYLLKIISEPGLRSAIFTSTVNIRNYDKKKNYKNIDYYDFLIKKRIYSKFVFSDEGGRFYRNETYNLIKILNKKERFIKKKNFYWFSHNQVIDLINKNLLSIEARNLFACFNIDKIK